MAQPEYFNKMEREAVYRLRELFAFQKEATIASSEAAEETFIRELAEAALYPEKPLLSFQEEQEKEFLENAWNPKQEDIEVFRFARQLKSKSCVRRLITCGGVDDGKSTLIGKILYETKSRKEQEAIRNNSAYLRKDGTVDYALLAGTTEEEARQGITVQVSYSVFERGTCSFLMADVPGHEEYTRNMAYAALTSDTAIIMIGANKGIVPQTRRHTRICYFMGIRNMLFAVNKMDMVSYDKHVFDLISEEITQMMQEYPGCSCQIVPVAAKSGTNITKSAEEMPWYSEGSLLDILEKTKECEKAQKEILKKAHFSLSVQRICKSSQIKGSVVKKRVIQGEIISGDLKLGDEILVYPTNQSAKVTGIYLLNRDVTMAEAGNPVGVEFDKELDIARGSVLTKADVLTFTDRIEADILWTSDNRLTQGKRYLVKIGTDIVNAAVTKICYQVDVNTGEHRYAEHLTKNALARCELCFSKQIPVTCEKENRILGTMQLIDREICSLAAYGNIVQTISEEAWEKDGREVTASERESALGQKAGMIWFAMEDKSEVYMNYVERYLLRMGFHTIQLIAEEIDDRELLHIKRFLDAGLIVLLETTSAGTKQTEQILKESERIFDCTKTEPKTENFGNVLKQIKQWASRLI